MCLDGDRDREFLFNFANGSEISGNTVKGRLQPAERWAGARARGMEAQEHGLPVSDQTELTLSMGARNGPEKCVFIYNANQNVFRDNWFEGCEIGIHFTAGSEGNEIDNNAFVNNRNQVKYVGTRYLDWSKNGRGNYWSDNPAFDLDAATASPIRLTGRTTSWTRCYGPPPRRRFSLIARLCRWFVGRRLSFLLFCRGESWTAIR